MFSLVGPAKILSGPTSGLRPIIHAGRSYSLSCSFTGGPAPTITWLVDGNAIDVDGNSRLTFVADINTTQLLFNPTDLSDTGSYQCSANNSIANVSLSPTFELTVVGEFSIKAHIN